MKYILCLILLFFIFACRKDKNNVVPASQSTIKDASNTWKAYQSFEEYYNALTFNIGNRIFFLDYSSKNIYEYSPADKKIIPLSIFPGAIQLVSGPLNNSLITVSNASYGYVLAGNSLSHFWEYNPVKDSWKQLQDFPGERREGMLAFSINNQVYIGFGFAFSDTNSNYKNDLWKYDATSDKWTHLTNSAVNARYGGCVFVIGNKAYVGTGLSNDNYLSDLWEFDGTSEIWTQKKDLPNNTYFKDAMPGRELAIASAIGGKGYICSGSGGNGVIPDMWEYDPKSDNWTEKARAIIGSDFINTSATWNGNIFYISGHGVTRFTP